MSGAPISTSCHMLTFILNLSSKDIKQNQHVQKWGKKNKIRKCRRFLVIRPTSYVYIYGNVCSQEIRNIHHANKRKEKEKDSKNPERWRHFA